MKETFFKKINYKHTSYSQYSTLMKYVIYSQLILAALLLTACSVTPEKSTDVELSDTLAVITERDLIPEGTAYDPKRERVLISSIYKRKIMAIEMDGSYYDFSGSVNGELWGILGMEVDTVRDKLWAISTKGSGIITTPVIQDTRWASKLVCFNLATGKLEKVVSVSSLVTTAFGFNDLTVSTSGDVYVTESLTSKIYKLHAASNQIEEFMILSDYSFLNGITFSSDESVLFVASTQGVLRIDMATHKVKLISYEYSYTPSPIDGLAFYKGDLIGHQNSQLVRFYLNESLDSMINHEVLDATGLNSSTTGEVGENGWYYYIANSQLRTGIDYKHNRIRSYDSLQNVVIKRKKL